MSTGSHEPVLLNEVVAALNVRRDGTYVDCTFGRGGHSRGILACLGSAGRVIALDRDEEAVAAGDEINDKRLRIFHGSFGRLRETLDAAQANRVDGILLDLGVSSPQLDDARRGFSFRQDGPLDMRMDTSGGITAAEWLAGAEEHEIREVIRDYGEERFARQIAAAIVAVRTREPVVTTRQLAGIVAKVVRKREPGQDQATRTFQAIRIHVNQELAELRLVLAQCPDVLAPGGRLVVISFHSLEDRIVKRFLRAQARGPEVPRRLPLRAHELPRPAFRILGRAQRASAREISANPRSRSAVLRVAERLVDGTH